MYNDIADIYLEIFPINQAFLDFMHGYLGKSGSTFLDLGCGPGDYVDALTRAGFTGAGIDSSVVMIEQAQVQKQGDFYTLSFSEINQLKETSDRVFDCAYCVGNSLSYLNPDDLDKFLKDVHALLGFSGTFVLQVVNWDKLFQMRSSDFPINTISEGRTFHRRYEWLDRSEVIFHTEIQKDGEPKGSWADSLYPKYFDSLLYHLQNAGLAITGKYGDYQKSPYNPKSSPAMILVAQKTG